MAYTTAADVKKLFPNTFRGDAANYPTDADIDEVISRTDEYIDRLANGPITDASDLKLVKAAATYMAAAQLLDMMYTELPDNALLQQRQRLWDMGMRFLEALDIYPLRLFPTSDSDIPTRITVKTDF